MIIKKFNNIFADINKSGFLTFVKSSLLTLVLKVNLFAKAIKNVQFNCLLYSWNDSVRIRIVLMSSGNFYTFSLFQKTIVGCLDFAGIKSKIVLLVAWKWFYFHVIIHFIKAIFCVTDNKTMIGYVDANLYSMRSLY